MNSLFQSGQSTRNTRNSTSNSIKVPRPHLECYRRSFAYSGATLWNNLSDELKTATSVPTFKSQYMKTFYS